LPTEKALLDRLPSGFGEIADLATAASETEAPVVGSLEYP